MVKFTQSMQKWLFKYRPELIWPLTFGHLEEFTDDDLRAYLSWCQTDEGRSYLKGGCNYIEEEEIQG